MKPLNPEIKFAGSGGIFDLMDNVVKAGFNITDDQFDFICEEATDEELDALTEVLFDNSMATFSQRRKSIEIRNKYVNLFNSKE